MYLYVRARFLLEYERIDTLLLHNWNVSFSRYGLDSVVPDSDLWLRTSSTDCHSIYPGQQHSEKMKKGLRIREFRPIAILGKRVIVY